VPTFINAQDNTLDQQAPAPRTVLYVEDHPVNVLLMQALFAKRPELRLVVAMDGEEGLRLAVQEKPELLLLDLRLPDCHGVELLQRMREVEHLRNVPAVAVTAEGMSDLTSQGFREIWHKPMDMRTTLVRLDWILAQPDIERSQAALADEPTATGWARPASARRATPDPIPFPAPRTAEPHASVIDAAA
jgi:CheY-like chemotaxis protein